MLRHLLASAGHGKTDEHHLYMFVKQQYCNSYGLNFTLSFGSNKSSYLKFITYSVPIEVVTMFKSILVLRYSSSFYFIEVSEFILVLFNSFVFDTLAPIFNLILLSKPVED